AVAHQVEPVSAPALAVLRRGEQALDQFLVGVGCGIADERLDLCRSWWQANQVEAGATDQGAAFRRGGRRELAVLHLSEQEGVDGSLHPRAIADRWRRDGSRRLERPELAALGEVHARLYGCGVCRTGEDGTVTHPLFQHSDLVVR